MAGHLLLVVLMYSFAEMKAQALPPPALTANPAVITETETVTLNCQPPSSVSVSQCYYRIGRGKPGKVFSCLKTLTGTELLEMTHQSSPAEVKVTCFYLYGSSSPDSDVSSIIIRTSLPPKLTVNPAVIEDTDSVTLNCQTPSSVSVSQCHFYTVNGGTAKVLSCLQTLTATELLEMAHQSSPAKIQVTCFYTVKVGELNYPSPHSDTSSITIHKSSVTQTVTTSLMTTGLTVSTPRASTTVTPVTSVVSTPSITTGFISTSVKPAPDTSMTALNPGSGNEATGWSVNTAGNKEVSNPATPQETASGMWIWRFVAVVAGCGVTVGVVVLVSAMLCKRRTESLILVIGAVVTMGVLLPGLALLFTQSRTEKSVSRRPKAIITGLLDGFDETYSIVTYECSSVMCVSLSSQSDDSSTSDTSALTDTVYSTPKSI
ncbi:uncharacterized protein LOC125892575 isoform X4 [Epinephelus fuscoguttatus]|uniref:uncharacterized protein LOC125892575 isoform X4 n=1 Tax=Epinephelus fuscoguttatus TaxID=293821 RepID=UPI0020D1B6FA|nr:uncharacterized protein LOC125892575 isoform X4 [Epinephelus fuscoguttatus]